MKPTKNQIEKTKKAMRNLQNQYEPFVPSVFFIPGVGYFELKQIPDWETFWCALEQITAESLGYA